MPCLFFILKEFTHLDPADLTHLVEFMLEQQKEGIR